MQCKFYVEKQGEQCIEWIGLRKIDFDKQIFNVMKMRYVNFVALTSQFAINHLKEYHMHKE